jgi:hypothetical protein
MGTEAEESQLWEAAINNEQWVTVTKIGPGSYEGTIVVAEACE